MSIASSTIDSDEIKRFSQLAEEWWNPHGKFALLHRLNPLRVGYIRDVLCHRYGRCLSLPEPLKGIRILDIGCGGGLISQPLTRLGAEVIGIDPEIHTITIARTSASNVGLNIDYRVSTVEEIATTNEKVDVVIAMEVIEHVTDTTMFWKGVSDVTKPGGVIVIGTLNRTIKALALAVIGAEYILRWLPPRSHDWKRFVKPSELSVALRSQGCKLDQLTGVVYRPTGFRLDPYDLSINYMAIASKID